MPPQPSPSRPPTSEPSLPLHPSLPSSNTFPCPSSSDSFWRRELHPLDSYRSTPDLPSTTDIAIIGAGMSGVSTAYHILQNHLASLTDHQPPSITILKARELCSGATGRNGGHLKLVVAHIASVLKKHVVEAANEIGEFHMKQMHVTKEVVDGEGIDCDFLLTRCFDVFMDEGQAREQEEEVGMLREAGIGVVKKEVDILRGESIEAVTGVKDAAGARTVPAVAFWPYKFVTGLMSVIIDQVNLQTHTMVTSVSDKHDADGFYHVHTSRGSIKARKVVFATNAYTAGILPSMQDVITPFKRTCSCVVREQYCGYRDMQKRTYTYNIWRDPDHVDYLNHRMDGSTIVGGAKLTFEEDPSKWVATIDDKTLIRDPAPQQYFEDRLQTYYQDWYDSGARVDQIWTGIMGSAPDGFSLIGKLPHRHDQYIIAGFNGAGMLYIFLTSKGLAQMIMDGTPFEQTVIPRIFRFTKERLQPGTGVDG